MIYTDYNHDAVTSASAFVDRALFVALRVCICCTSLALGVMMFTHMEANHQTAMFKVPAVSEPHADADRSAA
ncbi:hypothetical protein KUV57_12570 [Epibacterium sp. DP7N7-1]|nr:hypothetical protein [Epibacterium sp. DP7N7-1]